MKIIILISCLALIGYVSCEHGDFTNLYTVHVSGGEEDVDNIVKLLKKRSVRVISNSYTDIHGHTILYRDENVHARSKRSAFSNPTLSELSSHPNVLKVEQERELIRDKRDFKSREEIEHAKRVILEYLEEMKQKRKYSAQPEKKEYLISHDKQLELAEPEYFEDKKVYKRVKVGSGSSSKIEQREYNPEEDRCSTIQLNDEHWPDQWYLNNCGQAGGQKGLDVNVVPAWQQGYSGRNVSVCILDDGIEHTNDDLKDNYWAEISADFDAKEEGDDDPSPNPDDLDENSHGTRCAGEVAATANNSICGVGVAFNSRIGGVRILDGTVTDSLEAQALLFKNQLIDIYSASWGPRDNGKTMEAPGKYCQAALEEGVKKGRGGKGSIFVWATGNGGYTGDDCGADGYVSSPYTLSIGSINNYAESTYFMEWCPSTMAVIYTGGYHAKEDAMTLDMNHPMLKIVTTDVRNKCTLNFQGTSSAAPLAAGVMALVLEANPNLTWRDLQHIVVKTAKIPNTEEHGWTINGAGYHINDRFGYGALDAAQMIQEAQSWSNVGPQHACKASSADNLEQRFDVGESAKLSLDTDGCQKSHEERVDKLEHVQMHIKLSHPRRGRVKLSLTSPAGTKSEMLSPRRNDDSKDGIDFTFMTVRCWGENPRGSWTLVVTDAGDESIGGGIIYSWSLTLLGTAQSTKTRETSDLSSRKAYEPDRNDLDSLMNLESQAAVNVNIKKGDEDDVIKSFEGQIKGKLDNKLADQIKALLHGKTKDEMIKIVNKLKDDLELAKKERAKKAQEQLYNEMEESYGLYN